MWQDELFIKRCISKDFKLDFIHFRVFAQVIIGSYSDVKAVLLLLNIITNLFFVDLEIVTVSKK